MDRKLGSVPPFWGCGSRELGLHLTQGRVAEACLHTKWHLNPSSPLATTDMGRKLGGVCAPPPFLGGELGPHRTECGPGRVYLHAMCHFDPSNRLATIDQHCRQRGQTGQDNGPIAWVNRFTNGRSEMICRDCVKVSPDILALLFDLPSVLRDNSLPITEHFQTN